MQIETCLSADAYALTKEQMLHPGNGQYLGNIKISGIVPHGVCFDMSVRLKNGVSRLVGSAYIYWAPEKDSIAHITPFFRSKYSDISFDSEEILPLDYEAFKTSVLKKVATVERTIRAQALVYTTAHRSEHWPVAKPALHFP